MNPPSPGEPPRRPAAGVVVSFERRAGFARPAAHRLAAALALALAQLPPRPATLTDSIGVLARDLLAPVPPAPALRALDRLHEELFVAPGRERAMAALWSSALVTGALSARLARAAGLPVLEAAGAGLLHRVGDVCALGALARAESDARERLPETQALRLVTERQADLGPRLASRWALDAAMSEALLCWRDWPEDGTEGVASLSAVVYFAGLLATELAWPAAASPRAVDAAAREAGLPPALLADARAQFPLLRALLARYTWA